MVRASPLTPGGWVAEPAPSRLAGLPPHPHLLPPHWPKAQRCQEHSSTLTYLHRPPLPGGHPKHGLWLPVLGVLLAETGRGQSWPLSHVGVPFSQPRPAMCSRAGLPIAPRSKAPAVISLTSSAWHELPTPQVRAKAAPQAWRRAAGIVEGLPFIFADSPTHSPWAGPQGSRLLSLAPGQWRQVTAKQLPVLQASGAGTSSTPASPSPVPL